MLANAPQPATNYTYPIGGESAEIMLENILNGTYEENQDFNGDQQLTIADYTAIKRRHHISTTEGTQITLDSECIEAITSEFYPEEIQTYFYYEIYKVNNEVCRQYEITADEITQISVYVEFEEMATTINIELNPFTETATATAN